MNAIQTRYIDLIEKLGRGEPLHRSEQLWLCEFLKSQSEMFFPTAPNKGRPRQDDRNFWMTADSVFSGDAEKVVAARWRVKRIAGTLAKFRKDAELVIAESGSRDGFGRVIEWHRARLVKKRR